MREGDDDSGNDGNKRCFLVWQRRITQQLPVTTRALSHNPAYHRRSMMIYHSKRRIHCEARKTLKRKTSGAYSTAITIQAETSTVDFKRLWMLFTLLRGKHSGLFIPHFAFIYVSLCYSVSIFSVYCVYFTILYLLAGHCGFLLLSEYNFLYLPLTMPVHPLHLYYHMCHVLCILLYVFIHSFIRSFIHPSTLSLFACISTIYLFIY